MMMSKRPRSIAAAALVATAALAAAVSAQQADSPGWHTDTFETTGERIPGTGRIGGIAADRFGYLYVANFDLGVWRISPGGQVSQLADGLYGSSGNVVASNGDLLQGNWLANSIVRIDRTGRVHPFVSQGLDGPVGLTIVPNGEIYVVNSRGSYVARVSADGSEVSEFLRHELISEPNSIVSDGDGNLYVVNLGNTSVLKVTSSAEVEEIARLPGQGNAHVALGPDGALYVTKIWDHVVLRVQMDGSYEVVSGNGLEGFRDGAPGESMIAFPNGITASGGTLYFNNLEGDMENGEDGTIVVRSLHPPSGQRVLMAALEEGGAPALMETFGAMVQQQGGGDFGRVAPGVYGFVRYLVRKAETEAAFALIDAMVEGDPDKARAYLNAGNAHALAGSREDAIAFYRKALEAAPDDERVQRRLEAAELFRKS